MERFKRPVFMLHDNDLEKILECLGLDIEFLEDLEFIDYSLVVRVEPNNEG